MDKINLAYLTDPKLFNVNLLESHSSHKYEIEGFKHSSISLDGEWDFLRVQKWNDALLDIGSLKTQKIKVPCSAEVNFPEELMYANTEYPWEGHSDVKIGVVDLEKDPVNVYIRKFSSEELAGKRKILVFEGFESAIYVYLNGHFVGYSERLYVDSEFDITPYLVDGENTLVVYNFRFSTSSWILDQDFWKMSGIFRSVSIRFEEDPHLVDIDVKTNLDDTYENGLLSVSGKVSGEGEAHLFLDGGELPEPIKVVDGQFHFEKTIEEVDAWSAEIPCLYELKIELVGEEHAETTTMQIGFTREEVVDGQFLFNGKPVKMLGVNRHEFDMHLGRTQTDHDIKFDLENLKKNNVNAIRTCHYPNDKRFYELVNQMGFYVIDECCIESHGAWMEAMVAGDDSMWLPGDREEWRPLVHDRAESMYMRDRNNPCIFAWSLGNESAGGKLFADNADYFHSVDKKRLVHYEGECHAPALLEHLDVKSFMYKKPDELDKYAKAHPDKPVMECEFEHAMGNSCGNFDEYMDVFLNNKNCLGGFIWDYIDQLIIGKTKRSDEETTIYGGDQNDRPNCDNFVTDGIVFQDRDNFIPNPKLDIVKNTYCPLQIRFDGDNMLFSLIDPFYEPEDFIVSLKALDNGVEIYHEDNVGWTGEKSIALPKLKHNAELIFVATIRGNAPFNNTNNGVFDSENSKFAYKASEPKANIKIANGFRYMGIANDKGIEYHLNKFGRYAGLDGINVFGEEILRYPPRPTFWRPLTDNDRGNHFGETSYEWLGASKFIEPSTTEIGFSQKEDGSIEYVSVFNIKGGAKVNVVYTFAKGDYVDIEMIYKGAKHMPELPCLGLDFQWNKGLEKYEWYGKGPLDTYPDTLIGGTMGVYESNICDSMLPYSVPQACGNRMQTRFVKLPYKGKAIKIEALDKPFSFSYLPYSEFEIEAAYHMDELPPYRYSHLVIYGAMRGVGGDDSWGAPVHEKYTLSGEKDYSFKLRLSVVDDE